MYIQKKRSLKDIVVSESFLPVYHDFRILSSVFRQITFAVTAVSGIEIIRKKCYNSYKELFTGGNPYEYF